MAVVRQAHLDDAGSIATVHVAAWRCTYHNLLPADFLDRMSVDELTRRWAAILSQAREPIFVAEEEGRVVGFASGGAERERNPDYQAEIYAVYLLPQAQGRGLGRALVGAVASALHAAGHRSLLIWVLRDNLPARGFYEHLGGRIVGEHLLDFNAGFSVPEVAYGWDDLEPLSRPHG
jgi:GNAT superfamily N-acetyltransferase